MWPFSDKRAIKIHTEAQSGSFEHSDKNHLWGPWTLIEGRTFGIFYPREGYTTTGQMRRCKICGYTQTESI